MAKTNILLFHRLENETYSSESLSNLFLRQKNLKTAYRFFIFHIYFIKNMNHLVYNDEIKSYDLHTI